MARKHEQDHDNASDEWCTQAEVLDPIYEHFGPIGLDPFGHPSSLVKAERYVMLPKYRGARNDHNPPWRKGLLIFGDGLENSWDGQGLVFANGPFSKLRSDREYKSWAQKGAREGDEAILLVPVRTGSDWWQHFISPADVILFWRGRMHFHGAPHSATFHTALVYWGDRPQLMAKAFGEHHWRVEHGR